MRSSSCTIHHSLTPEASSILKHSLHLSRRRGHAQVTPLHVATTLLSSSSSSSSLLRRACIRSHPSPSLPLHCRALDLCFNVALNRLPTSPSSSSLLPHSSHPSLSNALIAALKRAQAHQRRGCIETQHHNNQPLVSIKVELDQLIISILDDPSVSRVMKEAGFSSITVKHNLEEDSTKAHIFTTFEPNQFLRPSVEKNEEDSIKARICTTFEPNQFLRPSVEKNEEDSIKARICTTFEANQFLRTSVEKEEDVRMVVEVMVRRKQQRSGGNAVVVVGDSVSMAESVVDELLVRMERGNVCEELRGAQIIKLQLSYVHLKLMSRVDVEMKVSDLRRRVFCSFEKGVVVVYVGDLRWAVGEEDRDGESLGGFKPVEYLITEIGRLLCELKSGVNGVGGERGRVWVLASSSYKTYMRCKIINPSFESQWDLQAVLVPSGGLALSLHAPCGIESVLSKLKQHHFQMLETRVSNAEEEDDKLLCCAECFANYEKEAASVLTFEAKDAVSGHSQLPCWLQSQKPEKLHKLNFLELRKKWKRLCQNLHQSRFSKAHSSSNPWWSNSLPSTKSMLAIEPSTMSITSHSKESTNQWKSLTTLSLCNPLFTDSVVRKRVLTQKLHENIPWQSEQIHLVVDALLDCKSSEKKGTWIKIHGNDHIAKKRLARVVAESFYGSTERVLHINVKKSASETVDLVKTALSKESRTVVLIHNIDCRNQEFISLIQDGIKFGFWKDSCGKEIDLVNLIFILMVGEEVDCDRVLRIWMWREGVEEEEEDESNCNEKRKRDWKPTREKKKKKPRTADGDELDLNVAITSNSDDEGALSDLTNDICAGVDELQLPATVVLNFDIKAEIFGEIVEGFRRRIQRAFDEVINGEERLIVDIASVEELATASGCFLEVEFERWVREIFQKCIPTVKNGGKVVRLGVEGGEGNVVELGFLASPLPIKIIVY